MAPHTLERSRLVVDVLIPALNEEATVGQVIDAVRAAGQPVRHIVLIDNGSTDATQTVAEAHGALVVSEPERGYGAACLRGLAFIDQQRTPPDVVVFMDADGSDEAPFNPNCNLGCTIDQFTCNDGTCVDLTVQCDNVPDCPDGSDELPDNPLCV